jgi:hypothetical protein
MLSLRVCMACYRSHGLDWDKFNVMDRSGLFECVVVSKMPGGSIKSTIDWDSKDAPPNHCPYKVEHLMAGQK